MIIKKNISNSRWNTELAKKILVQNVVTLLKFLTNSSLLKTYSKIMMSENLVLEEPFCLSAI